MAAFVIQWSYIVAPHSPDPQRKPIYMSALNRKIGQALLQPFGEFMPQV
jgi:hypothetical protein